MASEDPEEGIVGVLTWDDCGGCVHNDDGCSIPSGKFRESGVRVEDDNIVCTFYKSRDTDGK